MTTPTRQTPTSVTVLCHAGGLPNPWAKANGVEPLPDPVRCHKAEHRVNPPNDLHVNPRHGARCECCGQNGVHHVALDDAGQPTGWLPPCLRTYPQVITDALAGER